LETWISGNGLERDCHQIYGAVRCGEDIISLMSAEDAMAKAIFERYMDRLGRGRGAARLWAAQH
jgi:predicted NBD/HSP70 family sugar kinase